MTSYDPEKQRLTPVRFVEKRGSKVWWLFSCSCGGEVTARLDSVTTNHRRSCGCLRVEYMEVCGGKVRHGGAMTSGKSLEYKAWLSMRARCTQKCNNRYAEYGGRGIQVCGRWLHSFPNFLADMGTKPSLEHSLDRIDVNGHYEPGNVRWATRREQGGNKRNNHLVTWQGETHHVAEWERRLGFHSGVLQRRITDYKWSLEKAMTTPLRVWPKAA